MGQSQDNVQNDHRWHEHKHASMFAISQLSHESATAPLSCTYMQVFQQHLTVKHCLKIIGVAGMPPSYFRAHLWKN